jgi:hypothetical protein
MGGKQSAGVRARPVVTAFCSLPLNLLESHHDLIDP